MIDLLTNRPVCADWISDGKPDLWFSDDPKERKQATVICSTCPVRDLCSQNSDGDEGIWGGVDRAPKVQLKLEDRICPNGHVGSYTAFKDASKASGVNVACRECHRTRARNRARLKATSTGVNRPGGRTQ